MNREERRKAEREAAKQVKIETGMSTDTHLVGRRLPGVNIGSMQSRENMPISDQVDEIIRQSQAASEPLHEQAGHIPVIGALISPEGAWGVFCMRCSAGVEAYVYPCAVDPSDWPPQVLVAAPDLTLE